MKFAFIDEERVSHSIKTLCRVLQVTRQGYYAWKKREPSNHDLRDLELAALICPLHKEHWGVYGAPRMYVLLKRQGIKTSKKRVARIMKEYGLVGVAKKRKPATKKVKAETSSAIDLVERNFSADAPNKLWFADITYVRTLQGWLYLAVVFDIFSRMIVGWAMGSKMDAALVDEALRMGIARRRPAGGLVHHSDHGSQYRSLLLSKTMREHGILPSMGAIASPWDNAVTESLMSTIKAECIHHRTFETREIAQIELFEYIEVFYNRLRLHSALGNLSPVEFEEKMAAESEVA